MKIIFQKLERDVLGKCYIGQNTIFIDLKKNTNPCRTFFHETLHLEHPDWSETKVIREERKRWKKLSPRQIFALYKKLFSRRFLAKIEEA